MIHVLCLEICVLASGFVTLLWDLRYCLGNHVLYHTNICIFIKICAIFLEICDTKLVLVYLHGDTYAFIGIRDNALDNVTWTPYHHVCHLDHLLRVHLFS